MSRDTNTKLNFDGFETLESRQLLAGTVVASVNNAGDLVVEGDDLSNKISIQTNGVGIVLTALDGTTTIDDSGLSNSSFSGDIIIKMRGGNDEVQLYSYGAVNFRFDGGSGNDTLIG